MTFIIRLGLFPLVIKNQDNVAKMANASMETTAITTKMTEARQSSNHLEGMISFCLIILNFCIDLLLTTFFESLCSANADCRIARTLQRERYQAIEQFVVAIGSSKLIFKTSLLLDKIVTIRTNGTIQLNYFSGSHHFLSL